MANEQKFTAHRLVLAASIPYFNAMLLHEMIESRQEVIKLNGIEPSALEQIINYSYNGKMAISNDNVQALLIAANFFHLKSVKAACCEFVKKRLSVHEALATRLFAEQLMCHDLVAAADRFIAKHFARIATTHEFLTLASGDLAALLAIDELNVDGEEQVYESLIRWVKHDEEKRAATLADLLKLVRLPLASANYLVERIANEQLVRQSLKARDLLDEAIYYHLLPDRRDQFRTFNLKPRCCNDAFGFLYVVGASSSGIH